MIRVCIFHRAGRPFFEAQWTDPVTGRKKTRSAKTAIRREAERFAAKLETQLNEGTFRDPVRITFADATAKYEAEVFPSQAPRSADRMRDCWSIIRKAVDPGPLAAIQEDQIAAVANYLRKRHRSPFTIKTHLAHIRQFLRWAVRRRLLDRMPTIEMPGRDGEPMRGRPITTEEYERMQAATVLVVGGKSAAKWQRLQRGLWLSGLRLGEALALHWTDPTEICVELTGKIPMFRIQSGAEKGRKFRLLPMVPEFYAFLMETPAAERTGYVFGNLAENEADPRPLPAWISRRLAAIGEKAGVKVSTRNDPEDPKKRRIKWASAHDFRRAFGLRWALRVRAPVLMQLMRHESIHTTMTYYVGQNSEITGAEVWRVSANDSSDSHENQPSADSQDATKPA